MSFKIIMTTSVTRTRVSQHNIRPARPRPRPRPQRTRPRSIWSIFWSQTGLVWPTVSDHITGAYGTRACEPQTLPCIDATDHDVKATFTGAMICLLDASRDRSVTMSSGWKCTLHFCVTVECDVKFTVWRRKSCQQPKPVETCATPATSSIELTPSCVKPKVWLYHRGPQGYGYVAKCR